MFMHIVVLVGLIVLIGGLDVIRSIMSANLLITHGQMLQS